MNPVLGLARQRCQDDKGMVRKSALGLLEALLLIRGASQGPGPEDVLAVEAATADPLVRSY